MKKDTEERILDYVIRINTEILKINTRLGDLEVGVKEIKVKLAEHDEEFKEINMKLDWAAEKIFIDHENRIYALETKAA